MRRPIGHRRSAVLGAALSALVPLSCGQGQPPPGPSVDAELEAEPLPLPSGQPASSEPEADGHRPGEGHEIASIAMRTWVYQEPDDQATKLGYLRAGAVVERARLSAGNRGCDGGWYRVAPRGYVCLGKGATLDLDHEVVRAIPRGPRRDQPMPYRYVISKSPPPHLYFKLPTVEQQEDAEGDQKRTRSIALFGERQLGLLGDPDPIPSFLSEGHDLPKPYGAERPLHYRVHRGRANEESAFGLMATFDWQGRRMGLTTELDLIPVDRTRVAPLSEMRGVEVEGEGTPAIVWHHGVKAHEMTEDGQLRAAAPVPRRSGWVLTGKNNGSERGLVETTAGVWLPATSLRIAEVREDPAGFARHGRKWIDVSIEDQLLVAYEGKRPVFATLVSTGRGELGDPEETHATVRGTFMIHAKHVSGTMNGDEQTRESFDLHDVPYIQYFYKGYALHGAYWHDDFGKVRSHGCINLAPHDARWLFDWTDPEVPEGWHGALNHNAGTLVYIHR